MVTFARERRSLVLIKDKVLITVGCPIFPPFYIDIQFFLKYMVGVISL
jgi:hypothetical protein